jgi:hypothetical protein
MAEEAAEHAPERYDKPWPSDKNRAVGTPTQTRRLASTGSIAWTTGGFVTAWLMASNGNQVRVPSLPVLLDTE